MTDTVICTRKNCKNLVTTAEAAKRLKTCEPCRLSIREAKERSKARKCAVNAGEDNRQKTPIAPEKETLPLEPPRSPFQDITNRTTGSDDRPSDAASSPSDQRINGDVIERLPCSNEGENNDTPESSGETDIHMSLTVSQPLINVVLKLTYMLRNIKMCTSFGWH
jgi:hypothetical protein